jgi:hypothetical protein
MRFEFGTQVGPNSGSLLQHFRYPLHPRGLCRLMWRQAHGESAVEEMGRAHLAELKRTSPGRTRPGSTLSSTSTSSARSSRQGSGHHAAAMSNEALERQVTAKRRELERRLASPGDPASGAAAPITRTRSPQSAGATSRSAARSASRSASRTESQTADSARYQAQRPAAIAVRNDTSDPWNTGADVVMGGGGGAAGQLDSGSSQASPSGRTRSAVRFRESGGGGGGGGGGSSSGDGGRRGIERSGSGSLSGNDDHNDHDDDPDAGSDDSGSSRHAAQRRLRYGERRESIAGPPIDGGGSHAGAVTKLLGPDTPYSQATDDPKWRTFAIRACGLLRSKRSDGTQRRRRAIETGSSTRYIVQRMKEILHDAWPDLATLSITEWQGMVRVSVRMEELDVDELGLIAYMNSIAASDPVVKRYCLEKNQQLWASRVVSEDEERRFV